MARIIVENLRLDYPLVSVRGVSLKKAMLEQVAKVGGRVTASSSDIAVVRALDDVSFSLKEGDRLGLFGHNGSGKTTLIRVLSNIYAPTSGKLIVEGGRLPLFDINLGMDTEATGYENIRIRGLIAGQTEKEIHAGMDEIGEFSELGSYLELPVRTYSTGMVLRLMFAIATSMKGEVALMDEWLSVGDEDFQEKANKKLMEITENIGIPVIASQNQGFLKQICNKALKLKSGRVVAFGNINEIIPD